MNPLLALAAATRTEALVAAEAAFERGTFDVAGARALAGAYGATHINAATNRAITAVLAHRAGYYNNKAAFEDYKTAPRARTTSGRRPSITTSRSTSRRRTAPPSTAATAAAVYPMPKRLRRSRAHAHIATSSSFPCICFDRCLSRGGVETPIPPQT